RGRVGFGPPAAAPGAWAHALCDVLASVGLYQATLPADETTMYSVDAFRDGSLEIQKCCQPPGPATGLEFTVTPRPSLTTPATAQRDGSAVPAGNLPASA